MQCLRKQKDEKEDPSDIARKPADVSAANPLVWGYYKAFAWNYSIYLIEAIANDGKELTFKFKNLDAGTESAALKIPLTHPRFAYADAPNLIPSSVDIQSGRTIGLLLLNLAHRPAATFPAGPAGDATWKQLTDAAAAYNPGEEKHPRGAEVSLRLLIDLSRKLEKDLRALRTAMHTGGPPPPPSVDVDDVKSRIDAIERNM